MKKFYVFLLVSILFLTGCKADTKLEDIMILFTSDVHCNVNNNIGYDGLASYKKKLEASNKNVTLVDLGDAIQGDLIGSVSKGEYIIDIMNYLEYDLAILGNHEFGFGMDATKNIIDKFNGTYLSCNVEYTGSGDNKLKDLEPYKIISYGDVDVAYIGVTTPTTILSTRATYFMEDAAIVYDFYGGEDGNKLINKVQNTIDECKNLGADYIIGLTHLGSLDEDKPYSSRELIAATTGFDIVLDGHSHVKLSSDILEDKNGNDVTLASIGTAFDAIGQVVITGNGNISVSVIDEYNDKDTETTNYLNSIIKTFEDEFNKPLLSINKTLSIYDENGIRMIRSREVPLGSLIADAFRYVGGTDIAFVNSGGIKTGLNAGDICYADIYRVCPHGNSLVTLEATGQEIIDTLELSVIEVCSEYVIDGVAVGERGGFLHVSGLKFDVDTSISSPVILDEYEDLKEIVGKRRVSNIKILQNGEYVDIDPNKTYTITTIDYIAKDGGSSNNIFLDNKFIVETGPFDYQVLLEYLLNGLNGDLSKYSNTEGRINIK